LLSSVRFKPRFENDLRITDNWDEPFGIDAFAMRKLKRASILRHIGGLNRRYLISTASSSNR
jgi:hypothetical protein